MKLLLIGKNSFLSNNIELYLESTCSIKRVRHDEILSLSNLNTYDVIINFSIPKTYYNTPIEPNLTLDAQLAARIKNTKTRLIFLSSRKVYATSDKINYPSELDRTIPVDIYGANKRIQEKELLEILGDKVTILRIANVIGYINNPSHESFIGKGIINPIKNGAPIRLMVSPKTRKDFITLSYFQKVLIYFVLHERPGIYNLGAGFSTCLSDIITFILETFGTWPIHILSNQKKDQFCLNIKKLQAEKCFPFDRNELCSTCHDIGRQLATQTIRS